MTADEKIVALIQESQTLTLEKDSARLCAISEAATLVDKKEKPKKLATFRFLYEQAVDATDPHAALAAYRDAVVFFDPVEDRAAWASCKAGIWMDQDYSKKDQPATASTAQPSDANNQ